MRHSTGLTPTTALDITAERCRHLLFPIHPLVSLNAFGFSGICLDMFEELRVVHIRHRAPVPFPFRRADAGLTVVEAVDYVGFRRASDLDDVQPHRKKQLFPFVGRLEGTTRVHFWL